MPVLQIYNVRYPTGFKLSVGVIKSLQIRFGDGTDGRDGYDFSVP